MAALYNAKGASQSTLDFVGTKTHITTIAASSATSNGIKV
jgi:hypothetical protein